MVSIAGWITLVLAWLLPLCIIGNLPETIPIHYDGSGHVDGTGSRLTIFIMPVIATFVFALLYIVGCYPHAFNYPVAITPENAEIQYTLATRVLRILRLTLSATFIIIECEVIFPKVNQVLGVWSVALTLAMVFAPVTYMLVKSTRHK